ncbi:metal-dependent hydrolase [Methanosarcina hadiensis]|uniref:metal-dependent hydrolase n=1 Tax=Methanosarcina hadiensis TaxID=3078083 RepID=UPI00397768C5
MVNILSHLGVGILIALALGLRGKKLYIVALLSILPDLDIIPYSVFISVSNSLTHEARNQFFYLCGHREFTHSILFISLITSFIWIRSRDLIFTLGGFQSLLSHVYLDYITTWKMRPFYPLSTDASIIGAAYFYDPLLNLLPLLPFLIIFAIGLEKKRIMNGKFNKLYSFMNRSDDKLYASMVLVFLLWLTFMPVSKAFLINHISGSEEAQISYQNTYPESTNRFLTAYSFNSTHYKIMKISYLSGVEESEYVEKISVNGNIPDASVYIERAKRLYSSGVPQEIDYPVYEVSEDDGLVTVTLSDARNPYTENWAYFKSVYRFIFNKESGEYQVYASVQGDSEEKLGENWFIHDV